MATDPSPSKLSKSASGKKNGHLSERRSRKTRQQADPHSNVINPSSFVQATRPEPVLEVDEPAYLVTEEGPPQSSMESHRDIRANQDEFQRPMMTDR